MEQKRFNVLKYSGEIEEFSLEKLEASMRKCGVEAAEAEQIIQQIQPRLYDGITSDEIYKAVFSRLKKSNRVEASKYSLKRAIYDLGPTGYPFERMISALLRYKGFKTNVGIVLHGECVTHEIDILAERHGNAYAIECKFHSSSKFTSNVKIPLYIQSRFLDVQKKWNSNQRHKTHLKQGWLVTNTRFTNDAIQYGRCIGLTLMSWNYPKNNGIEKNIDKFRLYPITVLTTLSKAKKHELLARDIILVGELGQSPEVLTQLNLSPAQTKNVLEEVYQLCHM